MSTSRMNLAAVPGITVGHTTIEAHGTGCTVVLAPETGLRAAVCLRGRATGTRELDVLDPRHLVERIDAILFAGGSALGLGAADAYRACDNASADYADGLVGVGRGATCGKAAGLEKMVPAGLGSWAMQSGGGDVIVSALVVVNAVGDVRNARGEIIAGTVDSLTYLADCGAPLGDPERLTRNTTLAVVATNANLDRVQLQALAYSASDALARRITPYGTLFDGDVFFAVSTANLMPKF